MNRDPPDPAHPATPGFATERYEVTALPFIPFSATGGEALNNSGVVAGGIARPDGSVALAHWSKGVLTDLGVPPGLPSEEFDKPRVFGINDAGAIVGTVHTGAGELPSRSFVYERGRFSTLPLADPADLGGAAIGINDRREVVGYDRTAANKLVGWRWCDGVYSRLPVSGTHTAALAINSGGTIVGNSTPGLVRRLLAGRLRCRFERGYVVRRGNTRYLDGFVYAINDRGEAAGGSARGGEAMATVFKNGIATVILHLPSFAVGINSSADVVGSYRPAANGRRRLFMWSARAGALDLTPDGYRCAEAAAINDRGDVLGFGETDAGESRYFLLRRAADGVLTPKELAGAGQSALAERGLRLT